MSFDRLKRTQQRNRSPGYKLKPSQAICLENLKPPTSMKITYILGLDAAKHKIRAALRGAGEERFLLEKDLPVSAAGVRELLAQLHKCVPCPKQLLVLIEATGLLHLNWSAALGKAGYEVIVINPLIAHRLYRVENALRDNKTDPIDARGLCAIGALHGEKLLAKYRFVLEPERLGLQRMQTVRKALRTSLTNLKKTYQSLLDLSFPELAGLMELDGAGLRELLSQAPTPGIIAQKRLSTLQKDWRLRGKAARLKALAGDSIADPELAAASAPALQAILHSLALLEGQLRDLDQQIQSMVSQQQPETKALLQTIPGFGATIAAKVLAYLPSELLHSGNNRHAAARLQAFMGNEPRLKESGQYKGQTKMSKRGVETLRTAFFQAAFSAAQYDPELRAFYLCKRAQAKCHQVALSHLMRILTRRLVAVLRSRTPYRSNYNLTLQNAA
jgi:transposase